MPEVKTLTAEAIRAAFERSSVQAKRITLPNLGDVYVRRLTVSDVQNAPEPSEADAKAIEAMGTARAIAMAVCDESGQRVFDPNSVADLTLISEQGWHDMSELIVAVRGAHGADAKNA